jgi:hypothetical protein
MFGRTVFIALACLGGLLGPMKSLAQNAGDAGVSGIPHGPGSVGGVNNSVNDPSGIGNAARIQAPPPPSTAVPAVPSSPSVASRLSPRSTPVVRRVKPRAVVLSRRESRRSSAHTATRAREKLLDRKLNICRGC